MKKNKDKIIIKKRMYLDIVNLISLLEEDKFEIQDFIITHEEGIRIVLNLDTRDLEFTCKYL